jgi:hypothetical protein
LGRKTPAQASFHYAQLGSSAPIMITLLPMSSAVNQLIYAVHACSCYPLRLAYQRQCDEDDSSDEMKAVLDAQQCRNA